MRIARKIQLQGLHRKPILESKKKVLKISPSIFGRSNQLNAASQDDPIPGSFRCPKCLRYFDTNTELYEHLHDHENTGKDRTFRCKKCNTEDVVAYIYYEGYYHGDPNRRVIGMHCEECLEKIFGTEDMYRIPVQCTHIE